jgi:hypothetical protein
MKLEFSQHNLEKYSAITFHENPSGGNRIVPSGRTDGHDDPNSRSNNFAIAPKNVQSKTSNPRYRNSKADPCFSTNQEYMRTSPLEMFCVFTSRQRKREILTGDALHSLQWIPKFGETFCFTIRDIGRQRLLSRRLYLSNYTASLRRT